MYVNEKKSWCLMVDHHKFVEPSFHAPWLPWLPKKDPGTLGWLRGHSFHPHEVRCIQQLHPAAPGRALPPKHQPDIKLSGHH